MAITYAFLSGNQRKCAEYRTQLAKYNRLILVLPFSENEAERLQEIRRYLETADEKDRFVLRESSNLYVASDWDSGISTISTQETQGEEVYHISTLAVYTPGERNELKEKKYQAVVKGRIDLTLRQPGQDTNWWDDIFVADRSQANYEQERDLWGKNSARQIAIGQFICDHLIFKRLRDVDFMPHAPTEAVDFHPDRSAVAVLRANPFVQMAKLDQSPWGLGNLLTNLTNEGAFFRSADSVRSGNYFCPPISGIPRHKKADPFWQTTFQIHDYFHQAAPDQIYTGRSSAKHRNVYGAAGVMSEGITIVPADMLYVEAVKESGFDYDYSTRKINPLFGSLILPSGDKKTQLKALLKANVAFANLGDESLYRAMLKPGCEEAFAGYTNTYKHFFIPDLLWRADNYDDMVKRESQFAAWRDIVGPELFARAKLPILDDLVTKLEDSGADLSSYEACVMPIFEYLFEEVISPKLDPVVALSDEEAQSNAFRRYMIGQTFLYAVYRHVKGMTARGERMMTELRQTNPFSQADIQRIRTLYREDLAFLPYILPDDRLLYGQIFPLFSPSFLSYDFATTPYASTQAAIKAAFPKG